MSYEEEFEWAAVFLERNNNAQTTLSHLHQLPAAECKAQHCLEHHRSPHIGAAVKQPTRRPRHVLWGNVGNTAQYMNYP